MQGEWIPQSKAPLSSCAPIPLPVWRHASMWISSAYPLRRRRNGQPTIISLILYTLTAHPSSSDITECLKVTLIKARLQLFTCSPDKGMNFNALGFYYFHLKAPSIFLQTFIICSLICLFFIIYYPSFIDCFPLFMEKFLATSSASVNLCAPFQCCARGTTMPPEHRVLVALRYLSTQTYYSTIAET